MTYSDLYILGYLGGYDLASQSHRKVVVGRVPIYGFRGLCVHGCLLLRRRLLPLLLLLLLLRLLLLLLVALCPAAKGSSSNEGTQQYDNICQK